MADSAICTEVKAASAAGPASATGEIGNGRRCPQAVPAHGPERVAQRDQGGVARLELGRIVERSRGGAPRRRPERRARRGGRARRPAGRGGWPAARARPATPRSRRSAAPTWRRHLGQPWPARRPAAGERQRAASRAARTSSGARLRTAVGTGQDGDDPAHGGQATGRYQPGRGGSTVVATGPFHGRRRGPWPPPRPRRGWRPPPSPARAVRCRWPAPARGPSAPRRRSAAATSPAMRSATAGARAGRRAR